MLPTWLNSQTKNNSGCNYVYPERKDDESYRCAKIPVLWGESLCTGEELVSKRLCMRHCPGDDVYFLFITMKIRWEAEATLKHALVLHMVAKSGGPTVKSALLVGPRMVRERALCWCCGLLLKLGERMESHILGCRYRPAAWRIKTFNVVTQIVEILCLPKV